MSKTEQNQTITYTPYNCIILHIQRCVLKVSAENMIKDSDFRINTNIWA